MTLLGCAALVVALWWLGTGAVLRVDALPRPWRGVTMAGASLVGVVALIVAETTSGMSTTLGACAGFASALVLWGVVETSYYLGYVTGVHREPCPPGCTERRRFVLALGASIYHELAVIAAAALLGAVTLDAANDVAFWTFAVLALMRWSTKLNLFLGVPEFQQQWLPAHLEYVTTYIRRGGISALFPITAGLSLAAFAWFALAAVVAVPGSYLQVSAALLSVLVALGIVEHGFLLVRSREERLWLWALKPEDAGRRVAPASSEPR